MTTTELIPLNGPITASVIIPGSKSYTNRALLLAALTPQKVTIKNPLFSDDTQSMIACLQTLGIAIKISEDTIEVIGSIADIKEKHYELHADISGITIRFMLALSTIIPGIKTITGDEGLNKRPIKDLVNALKQLDAEIEYLANEGFPPLRVTSSHLESKTISLSGTLSSQYLSALLLIGPMVGGLTIHMDGDLISKPYIDMTIDTMKKFGVEVNNTHYKKFVIAARQNYHAKTYFVEGDFSSAGYFFAIAALTHSRLTAKNLKSESKQADKKLLAVLEKMGNKITYGENEITIEGHGVKPMEIDVTDFPDQAQTLAVLAAFAKGETKLIGVQSLRVKETERVIALQKELEKMGIKTLATNETLTINGGNPKPATIATYGDHRMAMSFAIAGAKLAGIKINEPEVVNKTFPEFWKKLNEIGIATEVKKKTNIVLIGMRGSGKSTIAKLLAQKLAKDFIDLDTLLEQKVGMPVAAIVAKHGWDFFRKNESAIAKELADTTNAIIATGGGIILQNENIDALKKNGTFILLRAPLEKLLARIGDDTNRAPLTNKKNKAEEIEEVWKQRKDLYQQAADIIIDTDTRTKEQTVTDILKKLKGIIL